MGIGQFCLVLGATALYRLFFSVRLSTKLLYEVEANNPDTWPSNTRLVASTVQWTWPSENKRTEHFFPEDVRKYATPRHFAYCTDCMKELASCQKYLEPQDWQRSMLFSMQNVNMSDKDKVREMPYLVYQNTCLYEGGARLLNTTFMDKTMLGFPQTLPCHLVPFSCQDYVQWPNAERKCDDELVCGCASGTVSVTILTYPSLMVCFSNAIAFVGYFEIVVTGLILAVYMTARSGPCWFRNKEAIEDLCKVALESKPEAHMELLHANE